MDLSKHLEKAAEAVKRRNYAFAVKVYSQLLAIQPDHGEARAGLRQALYKKAAQKPPSKLMAWLGGGIHLLAGGLLRLLGRHAAAAKAYERYLALDPLAESVNLKLADSLARAGHRRSALAVYRAYAEAQPRCLEAAREAGALLYEQGKLDEALAMYEQALKIDPRDQESLKARKNLAAEGALTRTGIATAKSSRELIKDKESHRQLEKQERLQLSKEEVGSELERLEEELQADPDDIKLLKQVARLREMDGDLAGALDCIERALQLEPSASDLQDLAGDLRLRQQEQQVRKARAAGDEQAAQRAEQALQEAEAAEYRRRVERNPTDLGLRFDLGRALLALGQLDAAIAELQQAVKDPRHRTEALLHLGRAFRAKELHELAVGQYEKALDSAGPTSPLTKDILYEMGTLCEEMQRYEDSLQYFSRILEQDIGFRDVAQKVEQIKKA